MTTTAVVVSLAVVAAIILVVGTAVAVYLDVLYRKQVEREKKQQQPITSTSAEQGSDDVEEEDDTDTDQEIDDPLRFPTVSAATARFKSWPYNIFVVTTTLHGALVQVFNFWWLDEITSTFKGKGEVEVISHLATIGLLVANVFLWLMSLIPAKGKGTPPHIVCGMVYFQAGICWMFWVTMVTNRIDRGVGWVVMEAILCSFSIMAAAWAMCHVTRTMKLYEKGTPEWKWSLHKGACGQFAFGILYALFLIVTAASAV